MVYSFVADHFAYLASIGLIALVVAPLAKRIGHLRAGAGIRRRDPARLRRSRGEGGKKVRQRRGPVATGPSPTTLTPGWPTTTSGWSSCAITDGSVTRRSGCGTAIAAAPPSLLETSPNAKLDDLAERLRGLSSDHDAQVADAMERRREPLIDEAIEQFKASLDLNPDNDQARGNLAVAMHRLGRYEEALTYWQALVAHGNATPDDRYRMGLTLEKLGRTDDAIADYERVLREAPDHLGAHLQLGELLAQEGRHDEAKVHFEFLVARYPASIQLHLYLGGRAEIDGEWAKAIEHYLTALKYAQDPSQAVELTTRLATIRAMCPDRQFRDANAAVQLVEPLVRVAERPDPTLLHILAAAFANMGRFDDAVHTAEEALALAKEREMTQLVDELEPRLAAYRARRADPD